MLLGLGLVLLLLWPAHQAVLITLSRAGTRPGRRRGRRLDDTPEAPDTPAGLRFEFLVPCLNEERVVATTVRGILALDSTAYPVRVTVIDDASDDGTPAVLAAIDDPRVRVLRRELPDARRGKGDALNAASRMLRAEADARGDADRVVVGVIDGDGRPSANMTTEVAGFLADPKVGAVQARVRIHNRARLLAAVQDVEFGTVNNAAQVARDLLGSVGLGGNGQFVRLPVLRSLGESPWSDCLVEDLELGLRLHLAGVRARYASRAAVTQQGLVDLNRLLRQRTRWAQGNVQCLRYVPRLIASRRVRNPALLDCLYYLLGPWLSVAGSLVGAAVWTWIGVLLLTSGEVPAGLLASGADLPPAVAVWSTVLFAPGLVWGLLHRVSLRDETWRRCLLAGACYPLFVLLGVASTWRAFGRESTRRRTWAKTDRLVEAPLAIGAG